MSGRHRALARRRKTDDDDVVDRRRDVRNVRALLLTRLGWSNRPSIVYIIIN